MYAEHIQKQASAEASNTGAISNAIGNVAMVIAGGVMAGGGGAMASSGIAEGGASGLAKAQLGNQVQKMGFQLIGRQIGGFSGIVIGSNMANAYQGQKQGTALQEMMQSISTEKSVDKSIARTEASMQAKEKYMPRDLLFKSAEEGGYGYSKEVFERREKKIKKQGEE